MEKSVFKSSLRSTELLEMKFVWNILRMVVYTVYEDRICV